MQRVRVGGMPIAHVAKAMGISRQCASRWVRRFDDEGEAGLVDRSSQRRKTRVGYDYIHSLIDDHSRLAYSKILDDERADTVAGSTSEPSPTSPTTESTASNG